MIRSNRTHMKSKEKKVRRRATDLVGSYKKICDTFLEQLMESETWQRTGADNEERPGSDNADDGRSDADRPTTLQQMEVVDIAALASDNPVNLSARGPESVPFSRALISTQVPNHLEQSTNEPIFVHVD